MNFVLLSLVFNLLLIKQSLGICGQNEQFYSCGACDGTCDKPVVRCLRICMTPGNCGCIPGFFRDALNSSACVDQNSPECFAQRECDEYEQYCACGACNGTCAEPDVFCTDECREGRCGCVAGFVRNDQYICVDRNSTDCVVERRLIR